MEQSERDKRVQAVLARRERDRLMNAKLGWHLTQDDQLIFTLWDRLFALYSTDGHFLPTPSATWDVSAECLLDDSSEEFTILVDDLHQKCLSTLKSCASDGDIWHAFENVNHSYYGLHFDEMPSHIAKWPISLLPNGDPCNIVSPDFSAGIISDLRSSITVFGGCLLNAVNEDLPRLFRKAMPPDESRGLVD